MRDTPLAAIEIEMQLIPGFTPRAWNICSIDKAQCYFL